MMKEDERNRETNDGEEEKEREDMDTTREE